MKKITTLTLSLSLLASPLFAFAEDGANGVTVTASADASTSVETGLRGDTKGGQTRPVIKAELRGDVRMMGKEDKASTALRARANENIGRLMSQLGGLGARLESLSGDTKDQFRVNMRERLNALESFKKDFENGSTTASTTLKERVKAFNEKAHEFMFTVRQGTVAAAAARVVAVADRFTTLADKLEVRIASSTTAGVDTASSTAALADMRAKIADAKSVAQTAVDAVKALTDSTDATVVQANIAAIKDAHAQVIAAQKDLIAARKDAALIIVEVKKTNHEVKQNREGEAITTVEASTTAQ